MSPDMPDSALPATATYWAFLHFYFMDKANACMHMAPVKFSPITFQLAKNVEDEYGELGYDEDILTDFSPEFGEVMRHRGRYEVDPGR